MSTAFLTDERTFWHSTGSQVLFLPAGGWVEPSGTGGADSPASKRRMLNLLAASGLLDEMTVATAEPATREDMLRVHTARYLDEFKRTSDAGGGDIGDFAPFIGGGFEIAALSAGLAMSAIDRVVAGNAPNAYALCRPAGHHCLPDRSMGFCLLANIPIAVEAARARHGLEKVAIVDWDVHHGNGTQAVYYDRADTLTISLHQENCFPPGYSGAEDRGAGDGEGANINIPLPAGSGDLAYRAALDRIVVPALDRFEPDLIVVANGMDAGAADPLARMMLYSESYRYMTERLLKTARKHCDGRLVVVHEGGYSEASVPFLALPILETLTGVRTEVEDPTLAVFVPQQPSQRAVDFQLAWIEDLAAAL